MGDPLFAVIHSFFFEQRQQEQNGKNKIHTTPTSHIPTYPTTFQNTSMRLGSACTLLILGGSLFLVLMASSLWSMTTTREETVYRLDDNLVIASNKRLTLDYSSGHEMTVIFRGHWKGEPIVCPFTFPRTHRSPQDGRLQTHSVDVPYADFLVCLARSPSGANKLDALTQDGTFIASAFHNTPSSEPFVLDKVEKTRADGKIHRICIL